MYRRLGSDGNNDCPRDAIAFLLLTKDIAKVNKEVIEECDARLSKTNMEESRWMGV